MDLSCCGSFYSYLRYYVNALEHSVIQCKWVLQIKYKVDGSLDKHKARLVAKGFQQKLGMDFYETFSSVVKPSTIWINFTLVVTRGWQIQQVDINNAFVNGDFQEVVYMHQPEGFVNTSSPTHLCQLKKALYDLRQAPRAWYDKLRAVLLTWGFKNSVAESSLFYLNHHGRFLLLLVYVDDILITGNSPSDIQCVISDLHQHFAIKTLGPVHYFLGFEVVRSASSIHLCQSEICS